MGRIVHVLPPGTLRRMLIARGLKAWRVILAKYPPEQISAAIKAYDQECERDDDIGPGLLFRYVEWQIDPEVTLAEVMAETLPSTADARAERDPLTEDLLTELETVRAQAARKRAASSGHRAASDSLAL